MISKLGAGVFATCMAALIAYPVMCLAESAQSSPPPAPPADVPDFAVARPPIICVDCDQPFDMPTHKQLLDGLANNSYVAELRAALYRQDIVHQFESKAHFDNCDFDGALDYLTSLIAEAGTHVEAAQIAKSANNENTMQDAVKRAFFALGQALHTLQDFYAHTNYVELQVPKVQKVTDIEIIAPWRPTGRERIGQLRNEGLYSGYVFWGFPQKCPSGTKSHHDLAKDSATTISGMRPIAHLQNLSQYKIAVFLAREASMLLMRDAFRRWPLLKEVNGANVAFEVVLDRRGL